MKPTDNSLHNTLPVPGPAPGEREVHSAESMSGYQATQGSLNLHRIAELEEFNGKLLRENMSLREQLGRVESTLEEVQKILAKCSGGEVAMDKDQVNPPIPCPYVVCGASCKGSLEKISVFHTDLGIHNGVDHNQQTETFKCRSCGKTFERNYQWKESG